MNTTLAVRIRRFNPVTGESDLAEYQVPFEEGLNVLRVINYIYEELDPTLGFMQSCFATYCGTCMVSVNGKEVLACKSLLKRKEDILIEPARRFLVIRDLAVNFDGKRV